jgi:hypothetical protein
MTGTSAAPALSPEETGIRLLDAAGALIQARIARIRDSFENEGAVHVTNTGIAGAHELSPLMPALGFDEKDWFTGGGQTAVGWQEQWAAPGLRRLDYYPPHLYLLPNGEVTSEKDFPSRVLFFCAAAPTTGGRIFLHRGEEVEKHIDAQGREGGKLLEKISTHGVMIERGFLDEKHPEKKNNYHQSWQERFGAQDAATALANARALKRQYDSCWWDEHDGLKTLMTRITLPGFARDSSGKSHFHFPRVALDAPSARNGYRRFPLGNGMEMTEQEKSILRKAYLATREGHALRQGDIILMDNIRFGHSREPYTGKRDVLAGMAGTESSDSKK